MPTSSATAVEERQLIEAIRRHDPAAWNELIERYQARVLAFVMSRLHDRTAAEDLVQETFLGFLVSLPNYDSRTRLETFLFSIASHKLIDALRATGRRPRLAGGGSTASTRAGGTCNPGDAVELVIDEDQRKASSLARSGERRDLAERALADALQSLVAAWTSRGEFERLKCAELLFLRGWDNRRAAESLGLTAQGVANHKSFIINKLRSSLERLGLFDALADRLTERDAAVPTE